VLERGDVPDVAPREIDAEYIGQPKQKEEAEDEGSAVEVPAAAAEESVAEEAAEPAPDAEVSAAIDPVTEDEQPEAAEATEPSTDEEEQKDV
jgi:hypothetical protein